MAYPKVRIKPKKKKKSPDAKLLNSQPTKQELLEVTTDKCPKCGYDGGFDISGIHGGCEGEVYEMHCPECDHYFDPRIHWKVVE